MNRKKTSHHRWSNHGVGLTGALAARIVIALAIAVAPLGGSSLGSESTKASGGTLPLQIGFQDEAEVRMVMVPVSVLDRRRQPVLDLLREEFEIFVDGEPVSILTFEPAIGGAGTPGPGARSVDERTGRLMSHTAITSPAPLQAGPSPPSAHVAVVVDVYQTRFTGTAIAFKAVKNMLETGMSPSSRIGLFIIKYGRLETLMPFTHDRSALLAALDGAYRDVSNRDLWVNEEPSRGKYGTESDCPKITQLSMAQAMRVRHVVDSLRGLSAAMESLTGRKGIVLVADGIRMRAGTNYVAARENPVGLWLMAHCPVSVQPEIARLVRELGEAGISLSPVSMIGLTFPDPGDHFSDQDGELLGTGSFLARETGGRRPVALNNFEHEVIAAVTQPLHRYLLGFRPPAPGPDGKKHRIVVRVQRSRVEVAARAQYVDGPVDPEGKRLLIGAALFPDRFQDIPVAGLVRVLSAGHGRQELHVQVTLDTSSLVWIPFDEKNARGELQISALLDDHHGHRRELFGSHYTITVSRHDPPAHLILQEAVPLDVERLSSMVVVVQDHLAERVGTWETEIQPTLVVGRADRHEVRVTAPVVMQSDPDSYLLTPTGEPLLGRRLGSKLFVPFESAGVGPRLRLAMVRVENLPAGGAVRFCLDTLEEAGCVQAALESVIRPPTSRRLRGATRKEKRASRVQGPGDDAVVAAWIAVGSSMLASGVIRVEVLDTEGRVQARTVRAAGAGRDGESSGHKTLVSVAGEAEQLLGGREHQRPGG